MTFDPREAEADRADLDRVVGVLDDEACRDIVSALDEPMTVREIADEADVPLSTTYRKLDRLRKASLVSERTQLRAGGHHRSRYLAHFDRIAVELDGDRDFRVEVERPLSDPEQRLVDVWSEVRRET
ncbi:winged helix-turn-helix domain-containing protein [Salinilacihabitans rarus]|uniref:winged helix-turn-helix domain-containing protein n=1 Tax=Salinilacihabitans rarus TaxID=2961596 RepID=UPI0020C92101|nr:helix-turn-helix domain-containing protein [Salinilacihabitans rarus]